MLIWFIGRRLWAKTNLINYIYMKLIHSLVPKGVHPLTWILYKTLHYNPQKGYLLCTKIYTKLTWNFIQCLIKRRIYIRHTLSRHHGFGTQERQTKRQEEKRIVAESKTIQSNPGNWWAYGVRRKEQKTIERNREQDHLVTSYDPHGSYGGPIKWELVLIMLAYFSNKY